LDINKKACAVFTTTNRVNTLCCIEFIIQNYVDQYIINLTIETLLPGFSFAMLVLSINVVYQLNILAGRGGGNVYQLHTRKSSLWSVN